MVHRRLSALLLTGLLFTPAFPQSGWAAKKYYPPDYSPPAEPKNVLEMPAQPPAASRQVIIKTVPVVKPVHQDPLVVLVNEHRFFEALRLVDARLKKSPGNVSLQLTRGDILRGEGRFDQAAAQFQGIYDHNRSKMTRALALNGLGWTHYRKAQQDEQSGNTEGFRHYAQLAENAFRHAVQLAPGLPDAWAGLGRTALLNKRFKEAEPAIRKALRLSPAGLKTQLAYAELLLLKNNPDEALQVLYGLKKTTTHEPDVFLLLALASLEVNRVDDAIINLKQLLDVAPEHTAGLRLLSVAYERKMKPEDAEQTLQKAIAVNPADERSVASLLKIYKRRGEQERGVLLLTTLLKSLPEQINYAVSLLSYLEDLQRWNQAYETGISLAPGLLGNAKLSAASQRAFAHLFAVAINQKGKSMLDGQAILAEPAVQTLQAYLNERLAKESGDGRLGLPERLDLLLINPLAPVQAPPLKLEALKADLPTAVQVAYLSGEQTLYAQLLKMVEHAPSQRLAIAKDLARLGDCANALELIQASLKETSGETNPERLLEREEAQRLKQELTELQSERQQHLTSIAILPRKIPAGYFEKAATEALRLGMGDWQTHAALAKAFEKRHAYSLAYKQQLLAAHFAPSRQERAYWERRAEKTRRRL
jgi:tetratricopeptide (TPR) repeat protein